ncbi:MAG: cation:proton antiporter [Deltaproteobacteria bacterium]|nr:cation:proton antiporter [Deltaproteobacteria bacterium]
MDQTFTALLLITGLAAVVPLAANAFGRLHIPIVVVEIIAGIIIGESGLDLIAKSETLEFLAEFGFAFLMFISGLELDFARLTRPSSSASSTRRSWVGPLPLALLVLLLTIGLAFGGSHLLAHFTEVKRPLLMALILSTTSLGVVLPVLKEHRLLGTSYGQYLLVAASIADLVTLVLMTVVIAAVSRGLTLDLLLVLVLILAFALFGRLARRVVTLPLIRRLAEELAHATAQIRVRGAFALMVAWVVLAHALGSEVIVGAFLAGAVVGAMAGTGESALREKLDAIGFGFFIPIFFMMVGVNLEIKQLGTADSSWTLVPILIALAYVVKMLPALVFRLRFSWREAIAAGTLLSSRLSLIIAVSAIALKIGAISESINAAVILVAVATCTLSPTLFGRIVPRRRVQRRSGVLIAGADQMAVLLATRLRATGRRAIVVYDEKFSSLDASADVAVGPALEPQTWLNAGIAAAEALVVLRSDNSVVRTLCQLGIDHGVPIVIARVDDANLTNELRALGVNVIQPATAMAVALEAALCFPSIFELIVDHDDAVEIGEATLQNSELIGKTLRSIHLPGNALILSIQRDDAALVPRSETVLRRGDQISLVGSPDSVHRTIELMLGET